jgi:hypothetical protein
MYEAENKLQLELEELDKQRFEHNKLLYRKYLKSKQKCEVEKARIADEMASGIENLNADTSPKQVYQPYAGRMNSWVQSSITNLNIRNEKQTSRVLDFWEVRSEVKESGQDLENVTKIFPQIPQDTMFENQKLGRVEIIGNEKIWNYPAEPKIVVKDPLVKRANENCHAVNLLDTNQISNFELSMSPEPV